MKAALLSVLLATTLLISLAPRTDAQLDQDLITKLPSKEVDAALSAPSRVPSAGRFEFHHWHQGEPPLKLIRQEEGFCVLTGIGGGFVGGGEEVRVYVGDDGYWYLGGKSMQKGVAATCLVVRFSGAEAPAAPASKRLRIVAASFSFGSHFADVTARVKTLLRGRGEFHADPDWLLVDPQPYWKKCLVIFCKINGKSAIFSADEGETVSREIILKKALVVSAKDTSSAGDRQTKERKPAENEQPGDDTE